VNARDAMSEGGQFTISTSNIDLDMTFAQTHPEVSPGAYVLLRVSDTGHGMDETTKAHLFEPFFTTKAPGKGTGLGLATVYGIVRQSGGIIEVESEQGRGTTFRLFLPQAADTNGQQAVPLDTDQILRGGTETILLVEDDEQIRAIASLILDSSGYSVLTAANGHEALKLYKTQRDTIALLVTDVIMPGMSGRQLSDRLLSLQPNLKVLFVSGYTDAEIGPHGVLEPEIAFLPKPYTLDDLVRKVREVLDR
jgi:CheY-like chemotaxis protein